MTQLLIETSVLYNNISKIDEKITMLIKIQISKEDVAGIVGLLTNQSSCSWNPYVEVLEVEHMPQGLE